MAESNLIFIQLAVILGIAASVGFIVRSLKLPLVVAYIIAGVLLSILNLFDPTSSVTLSILPEIGIAFALFFIGMELDLKEIKYLGKPIVVTSLAQIIVSMMLGFSIANLFGFPKMESIYLGIALSFSSTIVVVKLLLEKKDLSSLYGKLSLGILLVEDLVAVLVLMLMAVGHSSVDLGLTGGIPLLILLGKGVLLLSVSLIFSRYVLESVFSAMARSAELLFLAALAWCFVFVAWSLLLGFSVVIGAFLAGIALANSPFHYEIQGKVKPLRDFFVTLFFVYLGSKVTFGHLESTWPLIVAFTLFALIVKPIIYLIVLGLFGFRKHTLFNTSLTLSHISEFSLILLLVGTELGVVSEEALTVMALTGVISICVASVAISKSRKIYPKLVRFISLFEHDTYTHQSEARRENPALEDHVILIGAHRMGGEIIKFLKRESVPFMVLDFNPKVIQKLTGDRIHALYGDLGDPEILELLNLERSKLIISTANDLDDNLLLLHEVKKRKLPSVVMIRAASTQEAEMLYEAGADYVIMPEVVSGDFVAQALKSHWPNMNFFKHRAEAELTKLSRNHLAFE